MQEALVKKKIKKKKAKGKTLNVDVGSKWSLNMKKFHIIIIIIFERSFILKCCLYTLKGNIGIEVLFINLERKYWEEVENV